MRVCRALPCYRRPAWTQVCRHVWLALLRWLLLLAACALERALRSVLKGSREGFGGLLRRHAQLAQRFGGLHRPAEVARFGRLPLPARLPPKPLLPPLLKLPLLKPPQLVSQWLLLWPADKWRASHLSLWCLAGCCICSARRHSLCLL
jgi:hypothetical protein